MRKNIKKIVATALVAGMATVAFAGCTSSPKTSSMTEVMNVASELDSYSYSYELEIATETEGTMTVELYGDCTKDAVSMSVKVESDGIDDMELDYDVKDILVCTKDAMYINLKEIEDEFLADMDLGNYGLDADWIKLSYGTEVDFNSGSDMTETLFGDVEDAYSDLIDEEDGVYTIVIDDNDSAEEFLEATATMLEDNGEDWADLMVSAYDDFDYEAFISSFMNSLFMEMNKTFDLGMTASEIESGIEDIMAEIDFSEMEAEMDSTYYSDMFAELADDLRESIEYVDMEDVEIEISASQDGSEYVTEAKVEYVDYYSEETITFDFKSTIVAEDVKVSVPSEDVMSVEEAICVLIEEFAGDIEAEDTEDLFDGLRDTLEDVDLSGMSGMMNPSIDMDAVEDWEDWEDYDDWDEEW